MVLAMLSGACVLIIYPIIRGWMGCYQKRLVSANICITPPQDEGLNPQV
jgi:hypothetical protein